MEEAFAEDVYCVNGCSDTLTGCRPDQFVEILLIFSIIGGLLMFVWATREVPLMQMALLILAATGSAIIFTLDVFSANWRTSFLAISIGLLIYGIMVISKNFIDKKNKIYENEYGKLRR